MIPEDSESIDRDTAVRVPRPERERSLPRDAGDSSGGTGLRRIDSDVEPTDYFLDGSVAIEAGHVPDSQEKHAECSGLERPYPIRQRASVTSKSAMRAITAPKPA